MRSLLVPGLLAAVIVALVTIPTAASAHPTDSEPQTMAISADGDDVTITWNAATDELGLLADVIGLSDGGEFLVFEDGELDADASTKTPEVKLAAAPQAVEAYFDDHVIVTAAGGRCRGELQPLGDEITAGITVVYHCDREVHSATVYADTLMEIDPKYVIAASIANGENRLYQDGEREFAWDFAVLSVAAATEQGASGEGGHADDQAGLVLYATAAALGLLAAVGYWWRRRRAGTAKP